MNSGTFDRRSKFSQHRRSQRQTIRKHQRLARLLWRQKGERDFGKAPFLWPEAGPEAGINDRFDCPRAGRMRHFALAPPARFDEVPSKVCFDSRGHGASRLVSWFAGAEEV